MKRVVVPLLAGGLRRRLGQKEVVEEQGQQRLVDLPPGGARPRRVVRLGAAGDGHDRRVDEGVGRAGVIGDRRGRRRRRHHGEVGDTAEVEGTRASSAGVPAEEQDVEQADQRCALAAGGDVGAAEVGHDREAACVRRSRPGGRSGACRPRGRRLDPVEDGLAVGDDQRGSRMPLAEPVRPRRRTPARRPCRAGTPPPSWWRSAGAPPAAPRRARRGTAWSRARAA